MKLLVLAGDGIGPEIMASSLHVLETVDKKLDLGLQFTHRDVGLKAIAAQGTSLPGDILPLAWEMDGTLLGPMSNMQYPPRDQGGVNFSAAFRIGLDLYANVRPARTRQGLPHRGTEMDLVIMRENTEGMYPDRNMVSGPAEFMPVDGVAISMRKITQKACERIARRSFELARKRSGKVTAVHKANAFQMTDGLFLNTVRAVAKDFPDVALDDVLIDAMAALLVRDASRYDVICTTNFYGDTLSDLASELSGSLGLAGSLNAGDDHAAAQAQHGSAPDIAGQDKANPISMILSCAMLLDWHGQRTGAEKFVRAAELIEATIDKALENPQTRTADLGGTLGTSAFTKAIIERL
ncbi:isocitrate/isopropylmalate dehydrogenase family protein [Pelagibacterium lentulum]|uniref:3-isopropylmalate dehydrogenase n=1 Tax=Pelagibacterium lentulum TaxID=2029865 RepID=A0A916VUV0_9HYPH|nr:isocitrate/isopropylmalate dehydrogenase family protein [Pelagibacterium lentulum]GGA38590.1 3-isopropylmalate dehydrogenase [Pelagibacterium lentulum]